MSETYTVPRVSYSVNNHTSFQKYKDKKNPLTNIHELEIEPFTLEPKGEFFISLLESLMKFSVVQMQM